MHLLVVEDDRKLGRLLRRMLEDDRHVVELATDGKSGLEIALDAQGIEAMILDPSQAPWFRVLRHEAAIRYPTPRTVSICPPAAPSLSRR